MNTITIKTVLLFVFFSAILFSSCKEDQIDTFSGESNIYFSLQRWGSGIGRNYSINNFPVGDSVYSGVEWHGIQQSQDSLVVSLALDGTDEGSRIALVPVSLSGNITDYDRPLTYTIEKGTTAIEGEHFEVAKAFIPSKARIGAIAVRLDRASFKDTTFVIDFNLVPNEHFQTNYTTVNRSTSDTSKVNLQHFRLSVSGLLAKPEQWSTFEGYFGPFSRKKIFLVIEITDGDINKFYGNSPDIDLLIAWAGRLKSYLNKQKELGEPILDEDGSEMVTGRYV